MAYSAPKSKSRTTKGSSKRVSSAKKSGGTKKASAPRRKGY